MVQLNNDCFPYWKQLFAIRETAGFCHFPVPRILISHSEKNLSFARWAMQYLVEIIASEPSHQRSVGRERARELDGKVTHIKNSWLISWSPGASGLQLICWVLGSSQGKWDSLVFFSIPETSDINIIVTLKWTLILTSLSLYK